MRTSGDLNMAITPWGMGSAPKLFLRFTWLGRYFKVNLFKDAELTQMVGGWHNFVFKHDGDGTMRAPGLTFDLDVKALFLSPYTFTVEITPNLPAAFMGGPEPKFEL